jgi:hypothetical protein
MHIQNFNHIKRKGGVYLPILQTWFIIFVTPFRSLYNENNITYPNLYFSNSGGNKEHALMYFHNTLRDLWATLGRLTLK